MKKGMKLQIGIRLLMAGFFIAFGNFFLAAIAMALPGWNYIPGILATGLTDDQKREAEEMLAKIKTQTEDMLKAKGYMAKADIDAIIDQRMKALEGVDATQLKALFDAEKGVMAILKAQGEEIAALKGTAGKKVKTTFKTVLNKYKDQIKAVFDKREGSIQLDVPKVAVVMTTANTIDGHDDLPTDLIESFSEATFVAKRQPREYVYDLANVTTVAEVEKYITWLEEGDTEGAFAIVTEGGLKPLMSAALVRNHSEVRKAAGKYVVTEEFAKFYKNAYQIITRIINQQVLRDKAAILTTDLLADAAPYTASALDGAFDEPTDYHAIAAVAAQIEALDFVPDLLIMNPQDKWRIGMLQGSDGHFYLPNVPVVDPTGNLRILGFQVRTSNRVTVGNFLLGESGLWEIVQEGFTMRMGYGMTVTGGTSNGGGNVTDVQGDLDHNRFRVIIEQYFHNYLATNNDGSFVYADFDTVKAALETGVGS